MQGCLKRHESFINSYASGRSWPKIQSTQLLKQGYCFYVKGHKKGTFANSEVPEEMPHFAASPLGKVGNRPVNMHIDQTSGHYWF